MCRKGTSPHRWIAACISLAGLWPLSVAASPPSAPAPSLDLPMQAISRSDTPSRLVAPSADDPASSMDDRLLFESRRRKSGPEFPAPAGPPMASAPENGLVERTLMDAANVINAVGATERPLLAPAR